MSGHGYSKYTSGCRCEVCRSAKAEYMRSRRAVRTAPAREAIVDERGRVRMIAVGITHGTRSGYEEYACRCAPCSTAHRRWNKAGAS